jgi:beta-carotene ketolase (CrtW type)
MQKAFRLTKGLLYSSIDSWLGIIVAGTAIALWSSSLFAFLGSDLSKIPPILVVFAVLWRIFLQTGLFITAHDAIHGTVFPDNRVNHWIGRLATRLYALLPYDTLYEKHWQHHRHPASADDPDFAEGDRNNPFAWYVTFMKGYLDGKQAWVLLIGMALIFGILRWGFAFPTSNIFLFWVLPIIFSSMQLFYFGIFLPHRQPLGGYRNHHRAESSGYSAFWSFLTCYHFGYHWEHHEYPYLPWYKLPLVVKR